MADLACLHQFVEHRERLGDRRLVRVAAWRRRADARRVGAPLHGPLREMDLVEVDIVGLQPLQRFVDRVENVGAHQPRRAGRRETTVLGVRPTTLVARMTLSRFLRAFIQLPI